MKKLLSILPALLLAACVTTTTKTEKPDIVDLDALQTRLRTILPAKNYNFNGKKISTNGKVSTVLEIRITVAGVSPGNEEVTSLGRTVGTAVKNSLKDPAQFDKYRIVFVRVEESGGVTKQTSTGHIFSAKEL